VPGCCGRPVRNCEFCPEHQIVVNDAISWLNLATPDEFHGASREAQPD
jgi:hypothetical protein